MAQFGSALALGARGRGFESRYPDGSRRVGCRVHGPHRGNVTVAARKSVVAYPGNQR